MKNRGLRHYLGSLRESVPPFTKLSWVKNAIRSISFIHSKGVLHADISTKNFLVTDNLSLLLYDFFGSAIGHQDALAAEETRYRKVAGVEPFHNSVATEAFAIGGIVYEMMTGRRPYDEIEEEDEVERLFGESRFPSTRHISLGRVVTKCWSDGFGTAAEVLEDVLKAEALRVRGEKEDCPQTMAVHVNASVDRLSASVIRDTDAVEAELQAATKASLR